MAAIPEDARHETWESVYEKSVQLAELIKADGARTGERFDAMVVVPRGAYYPANIVSRELGFGATDLLHACIGSYESGSTERQAEFQLGQMPTAEQVKGKKLLIIEEVCDTGHTLPFLINYLNEAGAKEVKAGVLHYKPNRSETGYKPDWIVETTDKWVVYPWEIHDKN